MSKKLSPGRTVATPSTAAQIAATRELSVAVAASVATGVVSKRGAGSALRSILPLTLIGS